MNGTATVPVGWRIAGVVGELLAVAGLVLLGFLAYQTWGRTGQIEDAQAQLDQRLTQSWQTPPKTPRQAASGKSRQAMPAGTPLVRLSIPRLDMQWTVVEGVDLRSLRGALGHYPGTQLPGQVGNFAVAGHRFHGLFWDLDKVRPGDTILVEDRTARYVYRVESSTMVSPTDTAVLAPVPGRPGAAPSTAEITLTTCNPKWGHSQRLIVTGNLQSTVPKNPGTSAAPSGGAS